MGALAPWLETNACAWVRGARAPRPCRLVHMCPSAPEEEIAERSEGVDEQRQAPEQLAATDLIGRPTLHVAGGGELDAQLGERQ